MKAISMRNFILVLLGISIIVSIYILAVDDILWHDNPGHAYGLIAFIFGDIFLIGLIVYKPKMGVFLAMLWGGLQVILLISDAVTGLGIGANPSFAMRYLFLGENNPGGLSNLVLLVLYALIGLLSLAQVWRTRTEARVAQHHAA
jgi:hypothetical protein